MKTRAELDFEYDQPSRSRVIKDELNQGPTDTGLRRTIRDRN